MKLHELNPRWIVVEKNTEEVGITFDCPCCRTQRLGVFFHDIGEEVQDDNFLRAHNLDINHIWNRQGKTFATITLSPSIDVSAKGHWHGFITNGNIT